MTTTLIRFLLREAACGLVASVIIAMAPLFVDEAMWMISLPGVALAVWQC